MKLGNAKLILSMKGTLVDWIKEGFESQKQEVA